MRDLYEKIFFAIIGVICTFIILYNLTPYLYKNINFQYVGKGYSSTIDDEMFPTWTLLTTEKQLKDINFNENLDFEKYNYIACRGGKIKFIKTKLNEYLFKDKKKVIVYVNRMEQKDVYIYKIKKINLIHDLKAAPTYVIG